MTSEIDYDKLTYWTHTNEALYYELSIISYKSHGDLAVIAEALRRIMEGCGLIDTKGRPKRTIKGENEE